MAYMVNLKISHVAQRTGQAMGTAPLDKKEYVHNCAIYDQKCHKQSDSVIVEAHPDGYPQLSAFIESDTSKFLMARKFGYLRIRQLLDIQTDLAQYEQVLLDREENDRTSCPSAMQSRVHDTMREEWLQQSSCLKKIGRKLKEYGPCPSPFLGLLLNNSDDLVLRMHSIEGLKPPQPHNFDSFSNWIRVKNQLTADDASFLDRGEDFIALTGDYEYGLLDNIVERFISGCTPRNVPFELFLEQCYS